jgi:hypothetical protein
MSWTVFEPWPLEPQDGTLAKSYYNSLLNMYNYWEHLHEASTNIYKHNRAIMYNVFCTVHSLGIQIEKNRQVGVEER